ncbi:MAG TPA: sodium ion-translocating decarboxylase subunit beta, partial [Paludibacter sp.]|nr:sodium ion-translocating decarboxylase subunit beta [Paludibacter sp.]
MKELKYKIGFLLILLGLFLPTGIFAANVAESSLVMDSLTKFWSNTSFANFEFKYLIMIVIGIAFLYLGIAKNWEPLLLVPIGFGILVGNVPFTEGYQIGIYEKGSVMNILYSGVISGWYPPLI